MTQDEQNGPPENQGDPPGATTSVVCPRCDRQNQPASRFCFNCGLELTGPGNPAPAMDPRTPPPSPGVTPPSMQQQSGMAQEQHLEARTTPETQRQPGIDQGQPSGGASPPMQGQDTAATGAYFGPIQHADERTWSTLLHLSAFMGFLLPFGSIVAPLIVWLIFRGRSDMVGYHGKRALNFQISMAIYYVGVFVPAILLLNFAFVVGVLAFLLGLLVAAVLAIIWIVWTIIAAVRANRGDPPGFILAIPFLK